jgi:glycosyltransferase involved in cell wall biosynthesis
MFSKACTEIQNNYAIIYYFTFQSNFPNNTFFYFPKTHYSVSHYFAPSKKRAVPIGAKRLSLLLEREKETMRRIGMLGPFDPTLCDGASASMFDLLVFLQKQGNEVFIISFMHNNYLCQNNLQYLLDNNNTIIIARGVNFCNIIYKGINIYYEILHYTRAEMLGIHPGVLSRIVKKLKEYKGSYIFTVDADHASLLASTLAGSLGSHFFHSPIYIESFLSHPIRKKMLQKRIVFANSKFTKNKIKKLLDVYAVIWYPFVDLERCLATNKKKTNRTIGFYGGGLIKGDKLVNILIDEMPHNKFAVAGRNFKRISDTTPDNLEYMGDQTNMKDFYEKISLLIVPSLKYEGYSRVIIEASSNGIPVISNNIGGIPESIGNSGMLIDTKSSDNEMVNKYKSAIEKILNNEKVYHLYRKKALKRTKEYEKTIYRQSIYNYQKYLLL